MALLPGEEKEGIMKPIILASGSPRRRELLEQMGLTFTIMPAQGEEVITKETPAEAVQELSYGKAAEIFEKTDLTEAIVIGADTVVVLDAEIMGKPESEEGAFAMLKRLQGRTHRVYTGVTVMVKEGMKKREFTFSSCTEVDVFPMEDWEIKSYVNKGESLDKAGAYGIQGGFAVYVKGIRGEYNNVLGLPIAGLYQAMKEYGLLWEEEAG